MTANQLIPAAQYLRMSTEHQQYSIDNQERAISQYASTHNFVVVHSYSDSAKSGLLLKNRSALRELLRDVTTGETSYRAILVYDVSRWGRFQDTDEAAHYEFLCKSAGIPVHYCAETFANDGSMASLIMKALKRAMAGEYSRELGTKVLDGLKNLARLGFKQGGAPGYGLRRMLVSADRNPKQLLASTQRKSIATDRVILVPGPAEEVECVRLIYQMFVKEGYSVCGIVKELNCRGVPYHNKKWSHCSVMAILTQRKYMGCQVFNRASMRLGAAKVCNPPEEWIVTPGAYEGIIDEVTFVEAQNILGNLTIRKTDEQILESLQALLVSEGRLTAEIIDKSRDVPSASTYRERFGGILRAYQLIGYDVRAELAALNTRRRIHALREDLLSSICEMFPNELSITQCDKRHRARLQLRSGFMVALLVSRFEGRRNRWRVDPVAYECGLVTLLARLDQHNKGFLDYHVFAKMERRKNILLELESEWLNQGVRLPDLSQLSRVAKEVYAGKRAIGCRELI
ncbi:MAG TPA: recombinase family protein [Terriglobales bacterium]|nr:recombinase family protein [Terriglobales bacterium]